MQARWLICTTVALGCHVVGLAQTPSAEQPPPPPTETPTQAETPPADAPGADAPDEMMSRKPADMSTTELLALARSQLDGGNYQFAAVALGHVLGREERNVEALLMDAEIAIAMKDKERARLRFRTALAVNSQHFQANLGLGRLYVNSRIPRQATFYLEKAEEFSGPESPDDRSEMFVQLGKAYRATGSTQKAIQKIEQATKQDPQNFEAWKLLVSFRSDSEEHDRAIDDCNRHLIPLAKRRLSESPSDYNALLQAYEAYQTKLVVLQQFHQTHYDRNPDGTTSDRLVPGMEGAAANTINEVVSIRIVLNELNRRLGMFDLLPFARRAVEYDATNIRALKQYAQLLRHTAQHAAAREVFERILQLDPTDVDAQAELRAAPDPVAAMGSEG